MIEVRPIGAAHASSIARLASRPDVVAFGQHEPERPSSAWVAWLGPPDPHHGTTLGAWQGGELAAVARLGLNRTRRQLHCAQLDVLASRAPEGDAALDALLCALTDSCDRWLQVLRCVVQCPADHPRIGGLFAEHGFAPEARLRSSLRTGSALTDEAVLARLRDDVPVPEPLATSLRMPAQDPDRGTPRVTVRPIRPSDGPKMSATMSEPSVVWGTLQLPWQRPERWDERLASQQRRVIFLIAEVGNELAGAGALTLAREPRRAHVATLGMHVVTGYQGRGVGAGLMQALLEQAEKRAIRRVELTVYPDNVRAVRLYERAGFAHEGRSRRSSFRDGTYVDDLVMARLR